MVPWHMKNQIIKKAGTLPSGLGRDIVVTLPSLIPVQLSAYNLISRSLKGWMEFTGFHCAVQYIYDILQITGLLYIKYDAIFSLTTGRLG